MIINKGGVLYSFRFGLKGLMILNDLLYLDEDEKFLIYFSGFITDQPNMTIQDVKTLLSKCSKSEIEMLNNYIDRNFSFITPLEIKELYTRVVGEMGMAPSEFYQMTVKEINTAYEGFKRKLELDANIYLIALQKRNQQNAEIHLLEDKGYEIGNYIERRNVFKNLNIKED